MYHYEQRLAMDLRLEEDVDVLKGFGKCMHNGKLPKKGEHKIFFRHKRKIVFYCFPYA
jgi:hypothetical protein